MTIQTPVTRLVPIPFPLISCRRRLMCEATHIQSFDALLDKYALLHSTWLLYCTKDVNKKPESRNGIFCELETRPIVSTRKMSADTEFTPKTSTLAVLHLDLLDRPSARAAIHPIDSSPDQQSGQSPSHTHTQDKYCIER